MDLFRNYCKFILFFTLWSIASTTALAKSDTAKNVWEESYSLETNKKYAEAAQVLKSTYEKSPKDEFVLIRLGWLNYLMGSYNVSTDYYSKALAVNSDSIDARLGLTLPLMAQQRWKEAALYAKQVIDMANWSFTANTRLMICQSGQALWEELEKHATEFIKHYPSDPTAFVFLGRAQAMQGKKEQAIKSYQQALVRAPTNAEALKFIGSKK